MDAKIDLQLVPPRKSADDPGEPIVDDEVWEVVKAFWATNGPVAAQIDSYNYFVNVSSHRILNTVKTTTVEEDGKKFTVEMESMYFILPQYSEGDNTTKPYFPMECTYRNISYMAEVLVDIITTAASGAQTRQEKVCIGKIPVMTRSDLCNTTCFRNDRRTLAAIKEDPDDHGGYFILCPKGEGDTSAQRRVVVSQERSATNKVFVFSGRKTNPKFQYYAEIRSSEDNGFHTTTCCVGVIGTKISVLLPWVDATAIPLGILFFALGAKNYEEVAALVLGVGWRDKRDELDILMRALEYTYEFGIEEGGERGARDTCLLYIGIRGKKYTKTTEKVNNDEDDVLCGDDEEDEIHREKRKRGALADIQREAIFYAKYLLTSEFLPHLGTTESELPKKIFFLGYMVYKLLLVILGKRLCDDRDHYANKRVMSSGALFAQQFYGAMRRLQREIVKAARAGLSSGGYAVNISTALESNMLTNALTGALTNNKWGPNSQATGVAQLYEQFNYAASLANLRKISVPMQAEGGKIIAPRDAHGAHLFVACPAETPEGKKVGLLKNGALLVVLTHGTPPSHLIEIITLGFSDLIHCTTSALEERDVKVFVNGNYIGVTHDPIALTSSLRALRRRKNIQPDTSISYDSSQKEVHCWTDAGRLCHPVFIVENGRLVVTTSDIENIMNKRMTWGELLSTGRVELLDKEEEGYTFIAFTPSQLESEPPERKILYTHCEIHPALMYGIGGSIVPFPNHDQSPRVCYQSSMGKQAIGIPFMNYRQMMSDSFHVMAYVQRPLALSRSAVIFGFDKYPAGQNAIVAIMPRAFNEEDSIEMNGSSIDRGFMVSYKYVGYYAHARGTEEICIPKPDETNKYRGNYSKLDKDGIVKPGVYVEKGDILIGRVDKNTTLGGIHKKQYTDCSITYEHTWPAMVDKVQVGTNGDGYKYARVMTVQKRRPIVGDKFCYSPDHEILTTTGWVPIENVTVEHCVATLSKDGELEYQHPTDVISFDHKGEMVEVDSVQVGLCVTPNHKMYVRTRCDKEYRLLEASTLFDRHVHYKKNAQWSARGLEHFELPAVWYTSRKTILYPPKKLPILPWLTFFGIWIAEGWVRKSGVEIATNKKRVRTALEKCLSEMCYRYRYSSDSNKIFIADRQLKQYLIPFSLGAMNKFLPNCIWDLSKLQAQHLLESMMLSDGYTETPIYCTSSLRLKDDVMRLALHAGWAGNACACRSEGTYHIIRGKDNVTHVITALHTVMWRVTIVKTQTQPTVNKHIKGQQTEIKYTGKVYCCTVPNSVLYVRRVNNTVFHDPINRAKTSTYIQRPVWCGNSSCHAQKGTIGMIYRQEDLPFTQRGGQVPDLIVNSLAFPSRMTIAMLIEMLLGKVVTVASELHNITVRDLNAKFQGLSTSDDKPLVKRSRYTEEFDAMFRSSEAIIDATPFRNFDIEVIRREMKALGYEANGDEMMVNGTTGEMFKALIFIGPVFYQRLRHMAVDKAHGRARGGYTALSHQPVEGRAQGGGLRIGVQERDCILGQGAARMVRDRMLEQSDDYQMWVCRICGLPAVVDVARAIKECRLCTTSDVVLVRLPYGTKMILQELQGMNIVPRLMTTPFVDERK
jgi:DNA-directed RNA polymerase II subunit RPB2